MVKLAENGDFIFSMERSYLGMYKSSYERTKTAVQRKKKILQKSDSKFIFASLLVEMEMDSSLGGEENLKEATR